MIKNIMLIYPPIDPGYYIEGVNDSPPLGLVVLQNYITRTVGLPVKIDIIDGEYHTLEEIIRIIKNGSYDMIGAQPMMASYKSTLKIFSEAKKMGAITCMGGHHATQLAEQIITNRRELVDYIIMGDGEEAFAGLIKEEPLRNIPNIVYMDRDTGEIVHTFEKNVSLEFGKIDYIDPKVFEQYITGDGKKLERGQTLISFRSYSHKGCSNRLNSQYCFFCGRADKGVRFKTPEDYVDELVYMCSMPNVKYIFEIGDDFLQDKEWLTRVCELREKAIKDNNVHLKIFARANRVTSDIIPILKRLNVDEVAIGFESGSERILKGINKNATPEDNMRAATLLLSHGIDTIASFVLGLPGEDNDSLQATYEQALFLRELALKHLGRPPQEIIANLIEINPGSPAFKRLQRKFPDKYLHNDDLGIYETQNDYFAMEFSLNSQQKILDFRRNLAKWGKVINELGNYTYPAGWQKKELMESGDSESILICQ